jgi:hypothetical protein
MFLDKAGLVFPCTRFIFTIPPPVYKFLLPSHISYHLLNIYTNYQNHNQLIVFMIDNPCQNIIFDYHRLSC